MRGGGGDLTIRLERRRGSAGECETGLVSAGEYVELQVEDQGVGMTPEVQQKIFNPFFTTREDGTGLGLAISRKMIQVQHGAISVASQPGIGTTIMILIPCQP